MSLHEAVTESDSAPAVVEGEASSDEAVAESDSTPAKAETERAPSTVPAPRPSELPEDDWVTPSEEFLLENEALAVSGGTEKNETKD